ncbi:MAG TPA: TrbI F-type domain-containing protein [Legionellaceae bacterium]|nr:TrbI F-type domain-containing protein [Legionellaceae bacterium]
MQLNKMLITLALAANTILALIAIWISTITQTVATFDKDKIVKAFIGQLSQQNKAPEENALISARFAKNLKKAIEIYANKNHCLILKKDAALNLQNDATHEISKIVSTLMREKS